MPGEPPDHPPFTDAEWLAWESRTTRYNGEDGQERAVLLWEDYERILEWAKRPKA